MQRQDSGSPADSLRGRYEWTIQLCACTMSGRSTSRTRRSCHAERGIRSRRSVEPVVAVEESEGRDGAAEPIHVHAFDLLPPREPGMLNGRDGQVVAFPRQLDPRASTTCSSPPAIGG